MNSPEENPDQSDALLFLEEQGFQVEIEDSTPFPINPMARMHEMYSGLDLARTLRMLARWRRYDAIVGIGDAVAFFLVQVKRLLRLRKPIVLIDPALSHNYPRRQRLQDRILPHVDKVIVFGRAQLDYLRERYGDRVNAVFVPHRIDSSFYSPGEPAKCSQVAEVLSVGEDASRDFSTLIQAMKLCQQWGRDDLRCTIKTPLPFSNLPSNVELRRDRVSWIGLRDMYRRASVVALPLKDSIHAGGINTLLESMAVGRPVVTSASRGILDYVENGRTALLVEPENPKEMAHAILRLIDDSELSNRLGNAARETVLNDCNNTQYARTIAEILEEVLHRPHSPVASGEL